MKTVLIPGSSSLWTCFINGVKYAYPGGTTQTVPDEVAALISTTDDYPPAAPDVQQPFEAGSSLPITSAMLKGDGAGGATAATPGTDYQAPIDASHKLPIANVSGYTLKAMVVTYDDDTTETFQVVTADAN